MSHPRLPSSLTARLVVTAVALVAAVTVLVGVAATLGVRDYLQDRLDGEVRSSLERASHAPGPLGFGGTQSPDATGPESGPPDDLGDPPEVRGQGVDTLTAWFSADGEPGVGNVLEDDGDGQATIEEVSDEALSVLDEVPTDGEVHVVDVPGLGGYRVAATTDGSAEKVVAGLPTSEVDDVVATLVRWELLLVLAGVLVASAAGLVVVRRQLRPLREVAATAHAVAEQPLAEGDVELADRVPDHLTDERTEVGQVGAALNTLLAHVESSLGARHRSEQQVRQFVADASHELRTPLATIAGYSELARRRPDDSDALRTALAKVDEESLRMTALVEDLLLLARLDSGRPLERRPVDLTRLLLEAVSDARVLAPDHRWRLELPDDAVEVVGDEHRLHQVVTNLLTNARKHTPTGTTVTVSADRSGFAVHDDGPGFPADLVDHAFERFARGDASRHREGGVGLGLALVEAITRAHGGTVTLHSVAGDTTVTVVLAGG